MSPHLVLWLLGVGIVLGVGMLLGRFMRRRQREHMQRLKGKLGLREVVWVISSTFGYDDTVRVPAACR
jgi:hypothetical protein